MAVTVTYEHPVAGAVAPTAAQAAAVSMVSANVIATADADTTAVITHNMALTAAELAAGFPLVTILPLLQAVGALSEWAMTAKDANTCTFTKGTGAGSGNAGAQLRVVVQRPHTIIR